MNLWQTQNFLENMIEENTENIELTKELLLSYRNLMDKKAQIDIQWLKSDADIRKEYDKNDTEIYKANQTSNTEEPILIGNQG
ncbi:MAG: hypothetical protein Q9M36_04460 [Sulfurovum sp.]|nr:hypothetical protein [Sulfurovum sp.]